MALLITGCGVFFVVWYQAGAQTDSRQVASPFAGSTKLYAPGLACDDCGRQDAVYGRALADDGSGVRGLDIAIIRDDFRADAETGGDGSFSTQVPTGGVYHVSFVGVVCAASDWYPEPGCQGVAQFFAVNANKAVSVPLLEEVILFFERATATLRGTANGAESVWATRASDGAFAWAPAQPDGSFALGLGNGQWTVRSRSLDPLRYGPEVIVDVDGPGEATPVDLEPPVP